MKPRAKPTKKTMLVGLDFDGCVFNPAYIRACEKDRDQIIEDATAAFSLAFAAREIPHKNIFAAILQDFRYELWRAMRTPLGVSKNEIEGIIRAYVRRDTPRAFSENNECMQFLNDVSAPIIDKILEAHSELPAKARRHALTYNRGLILYIVKRAEAARVARIVLISLSNRQSKPLEQRNSINGLSFPVLLDLIKETQNQTDIVVEGDLMLLSDIMGDKPDGENLRAALAGEKRNYDTYVFDESKVTIAYCQANKYGDDELLYLAIDNERGILGDLTEFYFKNPDLIGTETTDVEFLEYSGEEVKPYAAPIKGKGIADPSYRATLKLMLTYCGVRSTPDYYRDISAARSLFYKEPLFEFKANRFQQPLQLIQALELYLKQVIASINDYNYRDQLLLTDCLTTLVNLLKSELQQSNPNPTSILIARESIKLLLWIKEPVTCKFLEEVSINQQRAAALAAFAENVRQHSNVFMHVNKDDKSTASYFKRQGNALFFRANQFHITIEKIESVMRDLIAHEKECLQKTMQRKTA